MPDLRRAARMAYRVLLAQQVRSLPVDPLALLRACRGTAVYTAEAAADALAISAAEVAALLRDADAVTFRLPDPEEDRYIILYRWDGHPARLRFTLAHELGHRLLGHTGSALAEEREADCFASHLLCPEAAVADLTTAEEIAYTCYVSHTCARSVMLRPASGVEPELLLAVRALLNLSQKDE